MTTPPNAPGWDAIDRAFAARHGGQTPHQFTSRTPYEPDSPSPLPAITVWESAAPRAFHYVTHGLSELFEKSSPFPEISGFGCELTLMLARTATDDVPAVWPLTLLQQIGRYVLGRGLGFDSGHAIDLGGPITPDAPSAITGLILLPDALVPSLDGPFGRVVFLRGHGVTTAEREALGELPLERLVGAFDELDAGGIVDPGRGCWTQDSDKSRTLKRWQLGIGMG